MIGADKFEWGRHLAHAVAAYRMHGDTPVQKYWYMEFRHEYDREQRLKECICSRYCKCPQQSLHSSDVLTGVLTAHLATSGKQCTDEVNMHLDAMQSCITMTRAQPIRNWIAHLPDIMLQK